MKTFLDITIARFFEKDNNTFGMFIVYNTLFFTVEDTAKILPVGEYDCHLVKSTTNLKAGLGFCYAINENIRDRGAFRFMHIGNTHKDVDGCLAGGLIYNAKLNMIQKSKEAVILFYDLLDKKIGLNPVHISIKDIVKEIKNG
jgi:hypothetical protein